MGARSRVNKIELMVESDRFNRRVGLITIFYDLEWLGLSGHDFSGLFRSCFIPQLIQFCKENPEYHILTSGGPGRLLNHLVEGKSFYMIGDGDKDPALVLNYLLDPQWPISYEDGISEALAELNNIKNRRKR